MVKVEPTQGEVEESSPPAREFDGTFNVKPKVYGTYSHPDQYDRGEEGGGGGGEQDEYQEDEYRDRRYTGYEYPPHAQPHKRERPPHEYDFPPSQRPRPPPHAQHDYHYPPEPERNRSSPPSASRDVPFASRDYGHGQGERRRYGDRDYDDVPLPDDRERRFERDYPHPPPEHFRGPPPPRERDREPPVQRDRPSVSTQMESIDYSHGGLTPNVQSIDYHHGQPSELPYHDRPPPSHPPPPPRVPDYYDNPPPEYPPQSGYGPGPFPPYVERFPPPHPFPMPPFGGPGGYFSGVDPATLFAAYSSQAGGSDVFTLCSETLIIIFLHTRNNILHTRNMILPLAL